MLEKSFPLLGALNQFPQVQVYLAKTYLQRLIGLIGKAEPTANEILLFKNSTSIHTVGMSHAIDIIFIDQDLKVVKIVSELKPLRLAMGPFSAKHVFECRSGFVKQNKIEKNQQLKITSTGDQCII